MIFLCEIYIVFSLSMDIIPLEIPQYFFLNLSYNRVWIIGRNFTLTHKNVGWGWCYKTCYSSNTIKYEQRAQSLSFCIGSKVFIYIKILVFFLFILNITILMHFWFTFTILFQFQLAVITSYRKLKYHIYGGLMVNKSTIRPSPKYEICLNFLAINYYLVVENIHIFHLLSLGVFLYFY